ncbi:MAG TPA: TMEM165/GDT1 family protein [Mycobacteriales bacterium]|nr:TMEM165/GDT1 family protein [Mycobacteriales bacterium]
MSVAVLFTVFGLILPAELPDKTMVATLVLATRFPAVPVIIGASLGFIAQAAIAVAAGSAIAQLPTTPVKAVSAAIFLVGAILTLRASGEEDEEERAVNEEVAGTSPRAGTWRVIGTSFIILFLAEWGDLTQLLTASLSAKYDDPIAVFLGSAGGLITAGVLAATGGKALLRVLPMVWIRRVAAAAFAVVAALTALEAARIL